MDSTIRFYNNLLIANFVLAVASIISALYFIKSELSNTFTQKYSSYFITPLIICLLTTLFLQLFLRSKYPNNHISNKVEGFLYFFAIFTICSVILIYLMIAAFTSSAIEWIKVHPNPMTNALIYVAAPSFIVSTLSIIMIISSFRIANKIRKNLQQLADQIKNFGSIDN